MQLDQVIDEFVLKSSPKPKSRIKVNSLQELRTFARDQIEHLHLKVDKAKQSLDFKHLKKLDLLQKLNPVFDKA